MTEPHQPYPLKNLLWFMIGLAILGTILALVLYFAVELPAQQALLHVPANLQEGQFFPPDYIDY